MKLHNRILLNLLPGLLPLFIFILADELWGTTIGLYVALGFGVSELFFTYIKTRKFEKFILIDIGLLVVLGGISIVLENEVFFKLKPALIEMIFAAIIGFSAFGKRNFIYEMSLRYIRDVRITPPGAKKLNKTLKILLYLTLVHILLVIYSAYYMSNEAWGFISGVLFYLMILGYFGFEVIKSKAVRKAIPGEELLPVVDEKGNLIGSAKRSECHFNKKDKFLHPVIHLHVFNSRGEIFLQHRSADKEVQPGKWDTAVGGHVSYGETLEESLKREAREEIGLSDLKVQFIEKYVWESDVEKELVFSFLTVTDQRVSCNPKEVDDGRFWDIDEISKKIGTGIFTPNFEKEFKILTNKLSDQ